MTTYHYKRITRPAFVSPSVLLLDHYFSLPRAQREREEEGEREERAQLIGRFHLLRVYRHPIDRRVVARSDATENRRTLARRKELGTTVNTPGSPQRRAATYRYARTLNTVVAAPMPRDNLRGELKQDGSARDRPPIFSPEGRQYD